MLFNNKSSGSIIKIYSPFAERMPFFFGEKSGSLLSLVIYVIRLSFDINDLISFIGAVSEPLLFIKIISISVNDWL